MYSPKIAKELIPRLYRLAKKRKVPMTGLVNTLLQEAVSEAEEPLGSERSEPMGLETFMNSLPWQRR